MKESQFLTSKSLVRHELGTERTRLVLKASLAVNTYALKDSRIQGVTFQMIRERNASPSLLNGAWFLQLFLDRNGHVEAQMPYEMSGSTAFDAQPYFHAIVL